MTWNYRIIQHENKELFISETYYNKKEQPTAHNNGHLFIGGDDLEEIKENIEWLYKEVKVALNKPILKNSDFVN